MFVLLCSVIYQKLRLTNSPTSASHETLCASLKETNNKKQIIKMEYQKNAFGETEQEAKDFEILVSKVISPLKGLTRQEIDRVLRRVKHFIENTAILT